MPAPALPLQMLGLTHPGHISHGPFAPYHPSFPPSRLHAEISQLPANAMPKGIKVNDTGVYFV